jgi:hypothetical protein
MQPPSRRGCLRGLVVYGNLSLRQKLAAGTDSFDAGCIRRLISELSYFLVLWVSKADLPCHLLRRNK